MKKNIFFYSSGFPPDNSAAAVRNYWMSKVLKDAGHNLEIFTNQRSFFKQASNQKHIIIRTIQEMIAGVELFFRVLFSSKDLYYFSSPPFLTCIAGIFACILKRKKYIFDVRDLYPQVVFHSNIINEKSIIGKLFLWLAAMAYKNAHAVVTVTEGLKKAILQMCPNCNVSLIYNGYDPNIFRHSEHKHADYTAVFHGTLGKFQRADLILEVAKELKEKDPDIKFIVIGDGPGSKHFEGDLPSNLTYLGPVNYNDIPAHISKCHIGLSFRTDDIISRDAFPVKVFEYIGVGIPVIISPPGEASKFIKANNLGVEVNNDVGAIISAIIQAKQNSFIIEAAQFSRETQSKKILGLL